MGWAGVWSRGMKDTNTTPKIHAVDEVLDESPIAFNNLFQHSVWCLVYTTLYLLLSTCLIILPLFIATAWPE